MKYYNGTNTVDINVGYTKLFKIDAHDNKLKLYWLENIEGLLKQDRYISKFSAIDLVRLNAEVTINCHFDSSSNINDIAKSIGQSLQLDANINAIMRQCFMENGL